MTRGSSKGERSDKQTRDESGREARLDGVLWAKYLDYCSARLCDVFLDLEEERVFELAQLVEKETGQRQGSLSFHDVARLLVEKMMDELSLPDFPTWAAAYENDPEKFERHLLGLWKSKTEPAGSSSSTANSQ